MDKQDESLKIQQQAKLKSPSTITENNSLLDKESTAVTINNQEDIDNGGTSIFEDVKENISEAFTPIKKNKMIEISQDYDGWHYGLRLEASPNLLMSCVVETLLELNTVIQFFGKKNHLNIPLDIYKQIFII